MQLKNIDYWSLIAIKIISEFDQFCIQNMIILLCYYIPLIFFNHLMLAVFHL